MTKFDIKFSFLLIYYRIFSKNVIEAFASYSLSDTNVSLVSYNAIDSHPLSLFVQGDYQKRDDLLSQPQFESILFITKNQLKEIFLPQLVKEFDQDGTCTIKLAGVIRKNTWKYYPQDTNMDLILNCTNLQPTFEIDPDSIIVQK